MRAFTDIDFTDPLNRLDPLARGLALFGKVLPGRIGGRYLYDVTRQNRPVTGSATVWPRPSHHHYPGGYGSVDLPDDNNYYYVWTPRGGLLKLHGISFTLAAWVRTPATNEDPIFSGTASSAFTCPLWALRHDGGSWLGLWDGGNWRDMTISVAASTWTHVCFSYNKATQTLKAYHNGRLGNTYTSINPNYSTETGQFVIGRRFFAGVTPYLGQLDDLMIWRERALGDTEVRGVYARSREGWPELLRRQDLVLPPAAAPLVTRRVLVIS